MSGHNGEIRCAAHGFEPTREAAMAAFTKSWRRAKASAVYVYERASSGYGLSPPRPSLASAL